MRVSFSHGDFNVANYDSMVVRLRRDDVDVFLLCLLLAPLSFWHGK